jgi:hypothetical protein
MQARPISSAGASAVGIGITEADLLATVGEFPEIEALSTDAKQFAKRRGDGEPP